MFAAAMAGSFLLLIVEFLLATTVQKLLQNLGLSKEASSLPFISEFSLLQTLVLLFAVNAFRSLLQFIVLHSSLYGNELVRCRLNLLAISEITLRADSKKSSGSKIVSLMSEIFPRTSGFFSTFTMFIALGIQCSGILIIMFFKSWKETLIAIAGLFLIGLVSFTLGKRIRKYSKDMPSKNANLMQGVERVSRNNLFIRISKFHIPEFRILATEARGYSALAVRSSFMSNLTAVIPALLGTLLLCCIIFISANYFQTPAAVLLALLYLLIRFVQTIGTASGLFGELSIYAPHVKAAASYAENIKKADMRLAFGPTESFRFNGEFKNNPVYPLEDIGGLIDVTNKLKAPDIIISNLSYSYPDVDNNILDNFNIQIHAGEQFGIIGRSGSGKTTLISLILGLIKAKSGGVLIDGEEPATLYDARRLRVGYVGPDPFLIQGTILENLTYGMSHSPKFDTVEDILTKVDLAFLISDQGEGLNRRISENGEGLSAGQKQRICIARALLREPNLLILDEPTANLDSSTEELIADTILRWKKNVTTIIISHHPGIFRHTDRIFDLETMRFTKS